MDNILKRTERNNQRKIDTSFNKKSDTFKRMNNSIAENFWLKSKTNELAEHKQLR